MWGQFHDGLRQGRKQYARIRAADPKDPRLEILQHACFACRMSPAPYGASPSSDFESQYKRILEAAECGTQAQLAKFLGITQARVSDARRRQNVPSDWLVKLFEKKRVSPEWIEARFRPSVFGGRHAPPAFE